MNKKNKLHVLITGGAGYIGSILVPHLLLHGYRITVFDICYFGTASIHPYAKHIRIVKGDIRNPPRGLCRGVHAVIHLAALSNDPTAEFNPVANMQINKDGAIKLAQMAKKAGVRRFIFASSCSIYDKGNVLKSKIQHEHDAVNPKNPYSLSKYLAEQELLSMCTNQFVVTVLRKGTVYGFSPRLRYDLIVNSMVRDALKQKQITVFSKGLQWRPLIAIEDVVEAYRIVLAAPLSLIKGEIFNIAENNYQVKSVADDVASAFAQHYSVALTTNFLHDDKADRSYRVSMEKAKKLLHFFPKIRITQAVPMLVKAIQSKKRYMDYTLPRYYNIQWMKPILEHMK